MRFEVACAKDGQEALSLLRQEAPPLTLLDLQLPRLSGMDVLHAIRREDLRKRTLKALPTARIAWPFSTSSATCSARPFCKRTATRREPPKLWACSGRVFPASFANSAIEIAEISARTDSGRAASRVLRGYCGHRRVSLASPAHRIGGPVSASTQLRPWPDRDMEPVVTELPRMAPLFRRTSPRNRSRRHCALRATGSPLPPSRA
jgi:hypothetical protein